MIPHPLLCGLVLWCMASTSLAGSAKILLYHHVSNTTPPSTSVTVASFEQHLKLIEEEGYRVVALQKIVDGLMAGGKLESNWVAITFDDAYQSVLTEALPRLKSRGWPFTVFVSTDLVDGGYGGYLDWNQLRTLESEGASIANHAVSHEHMVRRRSGESHEQWKSRISREVIDAQARLEAELESPLRLFAYPYGEVDQPLGDIMRSLGFGSFSQHSGPVGRTTNPYAIPRFPMGTGFDSVEALAEKLRTEHLPLVNPPFPATLLEANAPAPDLTLNIGDAGVAPGRMTCFVAGQPNANVVWDDGTATVTARKSLPPGRSKYTCTAPHPHVPRAYYWHSHLWIQPFPDGSWYEG